MVYRVLLITAGFVLFYLFFLPLSILEAGKKQVYEQGGDVVTTSVAIAFGAGIYPNGKPRDMLKDRLITAAELYREGKVKKILVSGDNRFVEYSEPDVMYAYLVKEEGIPAEDVIRDYAGRSTYETCIRAREIWNVRRALLISQGYHLPRAIFICERLGIESSGLSGTRQEYLAEVKFKIREMLAIHKAILDIYLLHPSYVGGEKEIDLSQI